MCFSHSARSSSGVAVWPARSCTMATTSLPQRSLGRPATTASYTAGCWASAASTSSAKIFSPPELMVTESRPCSSMSLGLVVVGDDHDDRTEDLLAGDAHVVAHAAEHGGLHACSTASPRSRC